MKTNKLYLTIVLLISILCFGSTALADLTLATDGKSDCTIVIPAKPPISVKDAAKELQRDIKESTGAKLEIKSDKDDINKPFISLGSTRQAKDADISIKDLKAGGYIIRTKDNNLYIRGMDTVAKVNLSRYHRHKPTFVPQPDTPGPQFTKNGGFSHGTANGVYSFLEKYLGVRWLMPGDLGRVVPKTNTFSISSIDYKYEPVFVWRHMGLLETTGKYLPKVAKWKMLQKIGYSFRLNANHNTWRTLNDGKTSSVHTDKIKKLYKKHRDWFAMDKDGNRPYPKDHRAKLETPNPSLVKYFADKAIEAFKDNPHQNTYSLSPPDGSLPWSKSSESKKYIDPPLSTRTDVPKVGKGSKKPTVTRLVLKWYRDISKIVEKKYPKGKLAGYLYSNFLYPPENGNIKLPDNFMPFIAPSFSYGYTLYRPKARKSWKYLMSTWGKVAPKTWFYYDLPNQIFKYPYLGMVTPPGVPILNFIFPRLLKHHIKGATIYGNISWSQSALANYIEAKMLWNPKLDAKKLQHDWLIHAYGKDAGKAMEIFYQHLNGWFKEYWIKHKYSKSSLRQHNYKSLYAPHCPQIENLFLAAYDKPMTGRQKKRLDLIKKNLIVLQWRLRNAGYLPHDYKSRLTFGDKKISDMLFTMGPDNAFLMFPAYWFRGKPKKATDPVKLQNYTKDKQIQSSKQVPNKNAILIFSKSNQKIKIHPKNIYSGVNIIEYYIYRYTKSSRWKRVDKGLLYDNGTITIDAKKDNTYYLAVTSFGYPMPTAQKRMKYSLTIEDSVLSKEVYKDGTIYIYPQSDKDSKTYVAIPKVLGLSTRQTTSGSVFVSTQSIADSARKSFLDKHKNYDFKVIKKMDKDWKFKTDAQDVGNKKGFFKTNFDDDNWKEISAIDQWLNQGFAGYYGSAWYRKSFNLPKKRSENYYLLFGNIDGDVDIYLNGKPIKRSKLGSGHKWDEPVVVDISGQIKSGKNMIAVKVTKKKYAAGIYRGAALLRKK